jgi:serine/threonine protein kinase
MGVIYRAHDPVINRQVAIKLVHTGLLGGDERTDFLERFQREAQAAARCAHPNIVAVYDFSTHDGNPFIAMEFVEGLNLAQLLARGPRMPVEQATDVILQLLAALDCAHGFGVVHRDIKPANVMILPRGQVKVTDFGISSVATSTLTQHGAILGTPSYMSPEQCRGDDVDARSDLFSTGGLFHELLTGQRAFAGRTFTEVAYRLLNEPAPRIMAAVPNVHHAVQAVLDRAMAKRVEDRYSSAAAMAAALETARLGMAHDDATVIDTSSSQRTPNAPSGGLDAAQLGEIERKLTQHVGPIARYLVQTASVAAGSVEELAGTLGGSIKQDLAREAFLNDVLGASRTRTGTDATAGSRLAMPLAAETIERIQLQFSRVMGPIAKVLVRRELAKVGNEDELREALARHIDLPADKAAFLRQR